MADADVLIKWRRSVIYALPPYGTSAVHYMAGETIRVAAADAARWLANGAAELVADPAPDPAIEPAGA